jgi:TPR repeat protein
MSDVNALLLKAEQGNTTAMVDLGIHFIENGNLEKALSWWEKAANLGDTGAVQNYLMVNFNPNLGKPDAGKCIDLLKKFVNKNGWATAVLGAVYCGSEHMMLKRVFGDGAFSSYKSTIEGLRLLKDECVNRAESNFDYFDYSMMINAYYPVGSAGNGSDFSDITIPKLQKALEYSEKVKARGLVPPNYTELHDSRIETFKKQITSRQ